MDDIYEVIIEGDNAGEVFCNDSCAESYAEQHYFGDDYEKDVSVNVILEPEEYKDELCAFCSVELK